MPQTALPSNEERAMLRDSVRGYLSEHWPPDRAVADATDPERLRALWRGLASQGLAALGCDPSEGGLREIVLVMQELGRAACPVPLLDAALLNLAQAAGALADPTWLPLLDAMRKGDAWVAWSFGLFDGDPPLVETGHAATHFAVLGSGPSMALLTASAPGLTVRPARAMGDDSLYRLDLEASGTSSRSFPRPLVDDLLAIAQLGVTARALGAATRAFELAVDYAKERKQFGQPIGRFQAIQHKLADCQIALQGLRLATDNAALQYDLQTTHWRWFAAAARSLACKTLRQVSLQTQHAFGAIGYSEEHEAPRHFKRVHLDALRYGGERAARETLAEHFLGADPQPLPAYDLGSAGNAFRDEVRAWLATHWSGERKQAHDALPFHQREYDADFARSLGATGWIGLAWPTRFGGQARGALEQLAFMEEMERVDAPRVGAPVQAAMLQVFGTEEQQRRLLPEILRGEAIYGMGYSEPDAGSDLASLRTRAVRDGDSYTIDGQKIWTTTYWGQYMLLATRTDATAKPAHAGITMFVVPMNTPGITVKTSTTMYGGTFANVFYDAVRVPVSARIGEENEGWKVLTGALATERGFIGGGIVLKVARAFEELCEHIRGAEVNGWPLCDDPLVRMRIADMAAQIEAGRQMMLHCARQVDAGTTPLEDAAASKVYSGELMERFGEMALDILGLQGTLSERSPGAVLRGRVEQNLRHSLMWVISIGTNEIQRSLIAQRGLGLPR